MHKEELSTADTAGSTPSFRKSGPESNPPPTPSAEEPKPIPNTNETEVLSELIAEHIRRNQNRVPKPQRGMVRTLASDQTISPTYQNGVRVHGE